MFKILMFVMGGAVIGGVVGTMLKAGGGQCPLTCNPWGGMITGAIIGFLLSGSTAGMQGGAARGPESVNVKHLAPNESLDALLAASPVVLVDFYADWCGPCRMLKPTLGSIADKYVALGLKVVAVNVDQHRELAGTHGVSGIPDVRLFRGGKQAEQWVGVRKAADYESAIEAALGATPTAAGG